MNWSNCVSEFSKFVCINWDHGNIDFKYGLWLFFTVVLSLTSYAYNVLLTPMLLSKGERVRLDRARTQIYRDELYEKFMLTLVVLLAYIMMVVRFALTNDIKKD